MWSVVKTEPGVGCCLLSMSKYDVSTWEIGRRSFVESEMTYRQWHIFVLWHAFDLEGLLLDVLCICRFSFFFFFLENTRDVRQGNLYFSLAMNNATSAIFNGCCLHSCFTVCCCGCTSWTLMRQTWAPSWTCWEPWKVYMTGISWPLTSGFFQFNRYLFQYECETSIRCLVSLIIIKATLCSTLFSELETRVQVWNK